MASEGGFLGMFAFAGAVVPTTLGRLDPIENRFVSHEKITHQGGESLAGAFNVKLDVEIPAFSFLKRKCSSMVLRGIKMSLQEIEQGRHVPAFMTMTFMNSAEGPTEHQDNSSLSFVEAVLAWSTLSLSTRQHGG